MDKKNKLYTKHITTQSQNKNNLYKNTNISNNHLNNRTKINYNSNNFNFIKLQNKNQKAKVKMRDQLKIYDQKIKKLKIKIKQYEKEKINIKNDYDKTKLENFQHFLLQEYNYKTTTNFQPSNVFEKTAEPSEM